MAGRWKKGIVLLLAVFMILSATGCGQEKEEQQQPQTEQPEQETVTEQETEPSQPVSEVEAPSLEEQIDEARAKNDDIIGWLKIDDLKIDGAVVQGKDNQYYERKNEWGQYSWTGSFFADYECNFDSREDLSKNTVIYGHNINFDDNKDGERFSQLFYFTDMDFAQNHPYIYFSINGDSDTVTGEEEKADNEMVWQIFSVFYTTTDFHYIKINKDYKNPEEGEITDAQLMNIITEAKQRSEYVYDVDVTGEDKILTLSTCSYKYGKRDDVRFVVMAKLLDKGEALQKTVQLKENTSKKTVE